MTRNSWIAVLILGASAILLANAQTVVRYLAMNADDTLVTAHTNFFTANSNLLNLAVSTDLGASSTTTNVTITSSNGDSVTLSATSTNTAGFISSADKDKLANIAYGADDIATKTTTDLAEGSNLYHTTARARSSISAGNGMTYDSSSGVMSSLTSSYTTVVASTPISAIAGGPNFCGAAQGYYYTNSISFNAIRIPTLSRAISETKGWRHVFVEVIKPNTNAVSTLSEHINSGFRLASGMTAIDPSKDTIQNIVVDLFDQRGAIKTVSSDDLATGQTYYIGWYVTDQGKPGEIAFNTASAPDALADSYYYHSGVGGEMYAYGGDPAFCVDRLYKSSSQTPPIRQDVSLPLRLYWTNSRTNVVRFDALSSAPLTAFQSAVAGLGDIYSDRVQYVFEVSAATRQAWISGWDKNFAPWYLRPVDVIVSSTTSNPRTLSMLVIGDSTSAGANWQTALQTGPLAGNNTVITFVGTAGSAPYQHEALSGRSIDDLHDNPTSNPFINGGVFDYDNYVTANLAGVYPGAVMVMLGINDIFSVVNAKDMVAEINARISDLKAIVADLLSASTPPAVYICTVIPPGKQSLWTAVDPVTTRDLYMASLRVWNNRVISEFDGRSDGVYVCPIHLQIDPETDYTDSVHPSTAGYGQLAESVFHFLKGYVTF